MDTYIVFWLAATVVFVLVVAYDSRAHIHMVCGRLICSVYNRTAWRQCRGSGNCIYTRFSCAFSSHKAMGREVHQFQDSEDNVDSLVGERAVLTEDADSMKQTGKAVVNGQEWTVRPQDETSIRKGELIEVVKISGVKLIVKRVKEA